MNLTNTFASATSAITPKSSIVSPTEFQSAMRYLAAGCSIIATADGGERMGLTVTAVCSVTADPAQLLVCVNRNVRAHDGIQNSGTVSVNVLSASQEALARRFAGMVENVRGEERFLEGNWSEGILGAPLLDDALAVFDCRVVETIAASTHTIFICEVMNALSPADAGATPLVFFNRNFVTPMAETTGKHH